MKVGDTYILRGDRPLLCLDHDRWREWVAKNHGRYRLKTPITVGINGTQLGTFTVSTVFLGVVAADGKLFETCVFDDPIDGYEQRYDTLDAARYGHQALVNSIKRCQSVEEMQRHFS